MDSTSKQEMVDFDSDLFRESLAQTVAWFDQHRSAIDASDLNKARGRLELAAQLRRDAAKSWEHRIFRRSLFKTREWRAARRLASDPITKPLANSLRSVDLKPSVDLTNGLANDTAEKVVFEVIRRRALLVSEVEIASTSPGRLLLYVPDENLACGAAESESLGFFDVNNIPPWDTWVHYDRGTLVSWVPDELVDIVTRGIDVNPEECIRWA